MSDYTRNTKEELLSILDEKQEKLYSNGIETRPTKMSEIEEIEDSYREKMKELRAECEKITGRPLRVPIPYVKSPLSNVGG